MFNPATGAVSARVSLATTSELNAAVAAAHAAFPGWSGTSPLRRSRVMFKFKELMEKNADKLAALITAEHGKVLSDASGEVARGLENVEFACAIPHLLKGVGYLPHNFLRRDVSPVKVNSQMSQTDFI